MSRRPIAFNNSSKGVNSIKKNKIEIGLASVDYSTNPGGVAWFNGADSTSQYVIYSDTYSLGTSTLANSKPICWATSDFTDANVLKVINGLPTRYNQTPFTTIASALEFVAGSPIYNMVGGTLDNIVTNNLILNFDCSQKNSYPGSGTSWYDLSGNGNDAILLNGATYSSANGGSIIFDGIDDYCNIATTQMTSNLITITGFIKWVTASSKMFFGFTTYDVWTASNALGYNTGNGDVYGISPATVTSLGLIGNWAHYTFVMTGTGSIPTNNKIYINGNLQTSSQQLSSTGNAPGFGGTLKLCDWVNGGYYGNMQYGNLQIYNKELSQAEITQNFNASKARFGL